MEKLQNALEKARKKRGEKTTRASTDLKSGPSARTPRADAGPTDRVRTRILSGSEYSEIDAIWSEIESFQPSPRALIKNRIVTMEACKEATPFDILRTKILLQMRQNGWKRLAITSPVAGCGKTTMACNLAVGLSRQQDIRSILFDMDLRRPRVSKAFDQDPPHTISDFLKGEVPFAKQALRLRRNMAISMAKASESDPTRLLLDEQTEQVLDDVQEHFKPDVMLFDLPPMLAGDDTRAFLKNVDCALIVARAEQTKFAQFDTCEREIGEHTNVLGVVLNGCRFSGAAGEYEYAEY